MIEENITAVVVVLGAILVILIALVVYLFWRVRRTEGDCELLIRGTQGRNFVEIVNDNISQVDMLIQEVDRLSDSYANVLRHLAGAVQHVGVVRFDAFRDLGGLLSFAVAMLDDRANGLVISSIYGRTESRTYVKPIVERGSSHDLSPEEREAIRLAMQSRDKGALPSEAKDVAHQERMSNLRLFHEKDLAEREQVELEARERRRGRPEEVELQREGKSRREVETGSRRSTTRERAVRETRPRPVERAPRRSREAEGERVRRLAQRAEREQRDRAKPSRGAGGERAGAERRQRSKGLDTPTERLRRREPGGD